MGSNWQRFCWSWLTSQDANLEGKPSCPWMVVQSCEVMRWSPPSIHEIQDLGVSPGSRSITTTQVGSSSESSQGWRMQHEKNPHRGGVGLKCGITHPEGAIKTTPWWEWGAWDPNSPNKTWSFMEWAMDIGQDICDTQSMCMASVRMACVAKIRTCGTREQGMFCLLRKLQLGEFGTQLLEGCVPQLGGVNPAGMSQIRG